MFGIIYLECFVCKYLYINYTVTLTTIICGANKPKHNIAIKTTVIVNSLNRTWVINQGKNIKVFGKQLSLDDQTLNPYITSHTDFKTTVFLLSVL